MPRIPARCWGQANDFSGIAVYLASPASGYVTGEQFVIDGRYTKFLRRKKGVQHTPLVDRSPLESGATAAGQGQASQSHTDQCHRHRLGRVSRCAEGHVIGKVQPAAGLAAIPIGVDRGAAVGVVI